ncbi:MAG TPA: hypothetical protein VK764_04770 [Terracidiphilus sp.]|jgi:hypothetical protein|nr:hypothetical protein [Terracidiphilus sp.]
MAHLSYLLARGLGYEFVGFSSLPVAGFSLQHWFFPNFFAGEGILCCRVEVK